MEYQPVTKKRRTDHNCGNCIECCPDYYKDKSVSRVSIDDCKMCSEVESCADENDCRIILQCTQCGLVLNNVNYAKCNQEHVFCEFCYVNTFKVHGCSKCKHDIDRRMGQGGPSTSDGYPLIYTPSNNMQNTENMECRCMMQCTQCGPSADPDNMLQCDRGHLFCESCYMNLCRHNGCPKCHYDAKRPFAMISDSSSSNSLLNRESIMDQAQYAYRVLRCECNMFQIERCEWLGPACEVKDHYIMYHPHNFSKIKNYIALCFPLPNFDEPSRTIQLIESENMLFYYKHSLNTVTKKFYAMVQMIAPEDSANRYFYQYRIKNGNDVLNIMEMCHSDSISDRKICALEKCIVVTINNLARYVVNGRLEIDLSIQKV